MEERKILLAIGAHAGDMEVSCGAALYKHARQGDRVVLLHLTPGEGGNPRMTPAAYGAQKRREAETIANAMGAEVLFGPYRDGELPVSDEARIFVADVIRQVKPTHIITHWRTSMHKDHAAAHVLTMDAVLLASLEAVDTGHERHRGVRAIYYTENWEDPEGLRRTSLWMSPLNWTRGGHGSPRTNSSREGFPHSRILTTTPLSPGCGEQLRGRSTPWPSMLIRLRRNGWWGALP